MRGPGDRAPKCLLGQKPTGSVSSEGHVSDPINADLGLDVLPGSWSLARAQMPHAREPGDLDAASLSIDDTLSREGEKPQAATEGIEKSDEVVVPKKSSKTWVTPVESMEGRTEAKGKSAKGNAFSTQSESDALTTLRRIGQRAKEKPEEKFTNLLSHVTPTLLKEAYERLQKKASPGVDGVTWEDYGARFDERINDLCNRVHRGSYHPQPVKRVYIPKGDGSVRPLGIPALEDKIVQQAVRMILEPIYEAMFVGFSYGFRPNRSAHGALDALAVAIEKKVSWVLDGDIRSFFDTVDHEWVKKFVEHRIGDSRMVRLIMKWLHAGMMESGQWREVESGTPQGGLISPLLSNLYLHYVFDLWAIQWRKRHARGEMYVVRYADDFVMAFQYESDALAMREALGARLAEFKLALHPDKTRVLEFGRFARATRETRGDRKPETFEFLGFTHIASFDRLGRFQLKRRTSRKKRRAKVKRLTEECRRRRHAPVTEQHAWLSAVLRGHDAYYAVPTNYRALAQFHQEVAWIWHRSLQRRSQRGRWTQSQRETFETRFPLPPPRILHPWPDKRFATR